MGFSSLGIVDFSTNPTPIANSGSFSNENGSTTYFASVGPKARAAQATAQKFHDIPNFKAGATAEFFDTLTLRKRDGSGDVPFTDGFLRIRTLTEGALSNGAAISSLLITGNAPSGTFDPIIFDRSYDPVTAEDAIFDVADIVRGLESLALAGGTKAFLEWKLESFANTQMAPFSEADFSSTAKILSIDLLRPDGTIDPTVEVLGTSGVVYSSQAQGNTVPEPASIAVWSLFGLGFAGFGYYRIRRKK